MNEKFCVLIKISLKYGPNGLINNNPALIHSMAWCQPDNKPLSEPMMLMFPDAITLGLKELKVLFVMYTV